MIHLLWPTIRPEVMKATHSHWMAMASHPEAVRLHMAVNAESQKQALRELGEAAVVGAVRRGAAYPSSILFRRLEAEVTDVVVFGADDIFPARGWDDWLSGQLNGHQDAVIANDGGQFGPCVTQPIMTFGCVLRLNRVVVHPSYYHFCADAELYQNLSELGLVRDLRGSSAPMFEHRNWAWGKRAKDDHDLFNIEMWERDSANLQARMRLPLAERLRIDEATYPLWTS